MIRRLLFNILFTCVAMGAMAQTTITGMVIDGTVNEPAIGASVIVVGTITGTVTDMDGQFSLDVPDEKFILQVSMVGYKTQVVNIKGKTSVSVTLQEDSQVMDEVDEVSGADWQQLIYQLGYSQEYSANVSGGSDKGWYSFSGSYTQQQGIIKNTGYERYGLSVNLGRHITDWFEIGTSQHFTHAKTNFQRTNSENTGIIRSSLIFYLR